MRNGTKTAKLKRGFYGLPNGGVIFIKTVIELSTINMKTGDRTSNYLYNLEITSNGNSQLGKKVYISKKVGKILAYLGNF